MSPVISLTRRIAGDNASSHAGDPPVAISDKTRDRCIVATPRDCPGMRAPNATGRLGFFFPPWEIPFAIFPIRAPPPCVCLYVFTRPSTPVPATSLAFRCPTVDGEAATTTEEPPPAEDAPLPLTSAKASLQPGIPLKSPTQKLPPSPALMLKQELKPSNPAPPVAKAPRGPKAVRTKPPPAPSPPEVPVPPELELYDSSSLNVEMDWSVLPTYKRATEFLANVAASSGRRVLGRDLWLITAGSPESALFPDPSNPEVPFPKPKVALIGNMHGDEKGNFQILLQFVKEICLDTVNSRVQLYIIPTMNPDGYVAATRSNANGIDLNRNCYSSDFPYARPMPTEALKGSYYEAAYFLLNGGASMEPETRVRGGGIIAIAMGKTNMARSREQFFIAIHVGIFTFVSYLLFLGSENGRLVASHEHLHGQGVIAIFTRWYTALGTLGDWMHHAERLHMVTLELHNRKTPTASDLATLYGLNRGSLFRFAEAAHLGLRARLLDARTRAPLRADILMDEPAGIWPPQVEDNGFIWKICVPGARYSGTIQPYDMFNLSIRYAPIRFSFKAPSSWDDVIKGSGTENLTFVRVFLAQRL
ncbi:hypothetical protein VOLCADRAFT_87144 [Volvox carteri f. nagariensis]|uniref:Peptidase M14 domain-containing protein n=1 Tax=Volvox carteri f. nagariensis TaxID=3068 RepID=D8TKA3_VOLCA|nr:uncharacterized protein VOLCADRAFT_87144 [Volvox carteri f. nagariensis]EFJ52216.1 hypothetical protein VOLCADRAFT_87144 [Volvox carteri f. nagariensis]|eukprot:XP_002946990.1 hypothetical protein VOLCADRAFT_87144 [Volvox carteri f. nagariensis]